MNKSLFSILCILGLTTGAVHAATKLDQFKNKVEQKLEDDVVPCASHPGWKFYVSSGVLTAAITAGVYAVLKNNWFTVATIINTKWASAIMWKEALVFLGGTAIFYANALLIKCMSHRGCMQSKSGCVDNEDKAQK